MKEDDLLLQLRDIHLPPELQAAPATDLALWPFVVFALLTATILAARHFNRNRWRRRAKADLSQILTTSDPTAQWTMLLAFASQLSSLSGRSITLPNAAFLRPESVTDVDRSEFISLLNAELRR